MIEIKNSNIENNTITNAKINDDTIEIGKLTTVLKNKLDGGVKIICGEDLTQINTNKNNDIVSLTRYRSINFINLECRKEHIIQI